VLLPRNVRFEPLPHTESPILFGKLESLPAVWIQRSEASGAALSSELIDPPTIHVDNIIASGESWHWAI
jgi:hypothetical protein